MLPFYDEWAVVGTYENWTRGVLSTFDAFLGQHNEHRIPITRVIFYLDFWLFAGRKGAPYVMLVVAHLALGILLGSLAAYGRAASERAAAIVLGCALFVAPIHRSDLDRRGHILSGVGRNGWPRSWRWRRITHARSICDSRADVLGGNDRAGMAYEEAHTSGAGIGHFADRRLFVGMGNCGVPKRFV